MRAVYLGLAGALLAAGAVQAADMVPLKIGQSYVMKRTAEDGSTREDTWTVAKEEAYGGKTFSVVQRQDGFQIWLRRENRALTYTAQGGKTIDTYSPDWNDWQWPLEVGRTWTSTYNFSSGGRSASNAGATWSVKAEESVTVPAGSFKALRIERAPGNQSNHVVTRWYAPELGLVVKQVESRSGQPGQIVQELVSHKSPP